MNTVSGGRFCASALESISTEPIKLGGTIAVYNPNCLTHIENPHKIDKDDPTKTVYDTAVNYDATAYYYEGTKKTDNTGIGVDKETKRGYQKAIKGGTLGFMAQDTGSDTDYQTVGIGLKAEDGGEVKATSSNVGLKIGTNYLFL
jgi:hypothetical protein